MSWEVYVICNKKNKKKEKKDVEGGEEYFKERDPHGQKDFSHSPSFPYCGTHVMVAQACWMIKTPNHYEMTIISPLFDRFRLGFSGSYVVSTICISADSFLLFVPDWRRFNVFTLTLWRHDVTMLSCYLALVHLIQEHGSTSSSGRVAYRPGIHWPLETDHVTIESQT